MKHGQGKMAKRREERERIHSGGVRNGRTELPGEGDKETAGSQASKGEQNMTFRKEDGFGFHWN